MSSAFRQAWQNIRRSPYQALSATLLVFVTFFIGYALTLFLLGSHRILEFFETRPQVTAFFRQDVEEPVLLAHKERLENFEYVREVRYVSQSEALAIYQEQTGNDPLLLELVTADILPPSLEVSTVSLDNLGTAAQELSQLEGIDEVVYQKDIVESLRYWTDLLRKIGIVVLSVFSFTAMLVIMVITSIRIASRRGEIRIMRLMGATKWYIQQPFLLEGMFYGIVGSVLGWSGVYLGISYATPLIQKFFAEVHLVPVAPQLMLILLGAGTAVGVLIGFIASMLSTRRLFKN